MLLRSVRLENFRAVKSARISFDTTTVLIGENDCGRSSVMEAIALALGWNSKDGEFLFQPFHIHRSNHPASSGTRSLSIALEFCESASGEWNGEGFEIVRDALPDAVGRYPRFWLEVTHDGEDPAGWAFRAAADQRLINDRAMLAWLRRRMPVFWMTDGLPSERRLEASPGQWADEQAQYLAEQVSRTQVRLRVFNQRERMDSLLDSRRPSRAEE